MTTIDAQSANIKIKVAVVVLDENKNILLIKEKGQKPSSAKWNCIKGSHETGELIFDAAIRECKEEAGVIVKLVHSLGVYISEDEGRIRVQFNFLANAKGNDTSVPSKKDQDARDENIQEVRWFSREELAQIKKNRLHLQSPIPTYPKFS